MGLSANVQIGGKPAAVVGLVRLQHAAPRRAARVGPVLRPPIVQIGPGHSGQPDGPDRRPAGGARPSRWPPAVSCRAASCRRSQPSDRVGGAMSGEFIGAGWAFPLRTDATGGIALVRREQRDRGEHPPHPRHRARRAADAARVRLRHPRLRLRPGRRHDRRPDRLRGPRLAAPLGAADRGRRRRSSTSPRTTRPCCTSTSATRSRTRTTRATSSSRST